MYIVINGQPVQLLQKIEKVESLLIINPPGERMIVNIEVGNAVKVWMQDIINRLENQHCTYNGILISKEVLIK